MVVLVEGTPGARPGNTAGVRAPVMTTGLVTGYVTALVKTLPCLRDLKGTAENVLVIRRTYGYRRIQTRGTELRSQIE